MTILMPAMPYILNCYGSPSLWVWDGRERVGGMLLGAAINERPELLSTALLPAPGG